MTRHTNVSPWAFPVGLTWTVGAIVVLACNGASRADWALDFDSAPRPDFVMRGLSAAGTPSATFQGVVQSGMLRMRDSRLPSAGGSVTAFAAVTGEAFTDVRVTGTVNVAGGSVNDLALLARAHVPTVSSYAAGVNFTTGQSYILKFVGGREVDNAVSSDPGQGSQPPLPVSASYFLLFDLVGNDLSLRVFNAPGGAVLSHIVYSDTGIGGPRFTSGVSGVANQVFGNTLLDGTFDNVAAAVIPEPACLLVGGLAVVLCAFRARGERAARR